MLRRNQGDLTVEVREVKTSGDIQVKTLPCRVESIQRVHDVAVLKLKLPVSERLQFMAGQYIDILMKDGKRRSFSLANAPHDDSALGCISAICRAAVFRACVSPDERKEIMRFQGPLGSFFLNEDSDKPILLLASGTGFAPVKAIVEQALHAGVTRKMVLYWGRARRRIVYE